MCFFPALQALRLFLVWDSEGVSESEDTVLEEIFQSVDAESDSKEDEKKDKKAGKKAHKKKRKSSESVDSGNSSAISVSSDSSKACRGM